MGFASVSYKSLITLVIVFCLAATGWAAAWPALGPDGGDVRSLSYDPQKPDHLYLGTATGTIYFSKDDGRTWERFAHLGVGDDYVLDHIVVNPQNSKVIYVGAWSVENQTTGELFRSGDGGKTWASLPGMKGKSVRALAMSASNPNVLVAGALDGVYRTLDGGDTWQRISPASDMQIKNIESIAIDPKDPNVVYAGTWHLAWKTANAGAAWEHINKGMIEDSDVFSIIVDSSNPSVVFASACSGIYRSEDSGELFHKIQGIPFSARRTRVLKQDPGNPAIIYAGTTEGLWKTTDSGREWRHVSSSEIVVNDVLVDPRNSQRVLLATDRGGVLVSDDGGQTLAASNHGYSHRYVTSLVADQSDPNTLYAGVVNDREWGGVFVSHDNGQHWLQESSGLGGRDIFTLQQGVNGTLIAGTNQGIFLLERGASEWRPSKSVVIESVSMHTVRRGRKRIQVERKTVRHTVLTARVDDIKVTPRGWLAATSAGLFLSTNDGRSWNGGPVLGKQDLIAVAASGNLEVTATRISLLISSDRGSTWGQATLPAFLTIRDLAITPEGQILVAAREGAYRSSDAGASWQHLLNGLPDKNISSIMYDEAGKRLLATSTVTGVVFESQNGGSSWQRGPDAGYPLRRVAVMNRRLVAATPFDGVVLQPASQMESAAVEQGASN
ncbi:MAG TPA: hypothetical protein VLV49_00740 [Terriglobales bacterium]|nr:hypothetical protein [Terriglobales bacterium]